MSRPQKRIRRVLVANRGEIALRILRTLKALGLQTIATYSDADRDAPHVQYADDAIHLGPSASTDSYLRADRIIEGALKARADAIHPGYGFLSENAGFCASVEESGLQFIGPSSATIQQLGDKLAARQAMSKTGIGPVPGTQEPLQDRDAALQAAREIGYPLLLKAAAGGGGKGIRIVRSEDELATLFAIAASEAQSSFGSSDLFAERYVERARHVEIQVLGDGDGRVRLFPERECSLQRRLQKLFEETPCPVLTESQREQLHDAAARVVRDTKYRSAGTLEFLLSPEGELYFLEVNTRIQVEHPVTECVTGVDLVAEQLAIADGKRFTNDAEVFTSRGAAVEFRVNAENPLADFQPAVGVVSRLRLPAGPGVRVDTALSEGQEITPFYDPLLAKVITHGADRREALSRLRVALDETIVQGVATTVPVGEALLRDASVLTGDYHCQFLMERLADPSFVSPPLSPDDVAPLAAAAAFLRARSSTSATTAPRTQEKSRWRQEPSEI